MSLSPPQTPLCSRIVSSLICLPEWASPTYKMRVEGFQARRMNPYLPFPISSFLNLLSCLLSDYLYPLPPGCFPSHISTLCEWCLPLPWLWRKREGGRVDWKGESWSGDESLKWTPEGGASRSNPRFTCGLHSVLLSCLSPWGCWLTVVLFAARVFIRINKSGVRGSHIHCTRLTGCVQAIRLHRCSAIKWHTHAYVLLMRWKQVGRFAIDIFAKLKRETKISLQSRSSEKNRDRSQDELTNTPRSSRWPAGRWCG